MESKIASSFNLSFEPVAILWSDEKPEGALQFKPGKRSCVMYPFAQVAKRGKSAVFDRETCGCFGGGTGLGFGAQYENFPGGLEMFACFLSKGIEGSKDPEKYAAIVNRMPPERRELLLKGERFQTSPEKTRRFFENLPVTEIPSKYVVFKPLREVEEGDEIKGVVFTVNALQFSGLATLVGAVRDASEAVFTPAGAAACQQMGIFLYREEESENPRAILGFTDLAARKHLRRIMGDDILTFAVPYRLFLEMEAEVAAGLLDSPSWKILTDPE
jgi:uncharacterized protein (DUF169 family)